MTDNFNANILRFANSTHYVTPECFRINESQEDSELLALAVNYAIRNDLDVYLPGSSYTVAEIAITESGKTRIFGNNVTMYLKENESNNNNTIYYYNILHCTVAVDLTIEGLTFIGKTAPNFSMINMQYPDLISMSNGGSLTIRRCTFHDIKASTFNGDIDPSYYPDPITIPRVNYVDRRGYIVTGIGLDNFVFEDNEIYNCGGEEIMWICPIGDKNKTTVVFNRNHIHDITGWSFDLYGHLITVQDNHIDNFNNKASIFNFICNTAEVANNIVLNSTCLDVFDFCEQGNQYGLDVSVCNNTVDITNGGLVRTCGNRAVITGNSVTGAWFTLDYKGHTPFDSVNLYPACLVKNDWIATQELVIRDNKFTFKQMQNSGWNNENPIRVGNIGNHMQPADYDSSMVDQVTGKSITWAVVEADTEKKEVIDLARKEIRTAYNVQISGNVFDMSADTVDHSNDELFLIFESKNLSIDNNSIVAPRSDSFYTNSHTLMYLVPYHEGFGSVKFSENHVRYQADGKTRYIFFPVHLAYLDENRPAWFIKNLYVENNVWEKADGTPETVYLGWLLQNNGTPTNKIRNVKFTSDVIRATIASANDTYALNVANATKERPMQYGVHTDTIAANTSSLFEVTFTPGFRRKPIVFGTVVDAGANAAEVTISVKVVTANVVRFIVSNNASTAKTLVVNWMAIEPAETESTNE